MAHPTQLNPTEQDALVKQIGLALLRAAPQDWDQIVIDYRAVGRHQESAGQVVTSNGEGRPWRISGDIATLFAKLRAGMYRDGRGTWFNARYQLDRPTSYNLEYDRDEPTWDNPPPPQAYTDELRTFPREEDNVPEWLMRRLAGLTPERPGPHFRMARTFDGMGQSGRPVVNRPPVDDSDRDDLLEYLDRAPVVIPGRGFDVDRLDAESRQSVPVAFHSDGTWIWPASVNYYLRKYRVPPEPELVEHVRAQGFAVPEVDDATKAAAAGYLDRGALPRQGPPAPPPGRPPVRPAGPGPGRPPVAALPSQGGPGPALGQLTAKLAEYGVPESVVRIGPPVENTWTLERTDDGWRVGFFQNREFVAPAMFEDVADAAAFLLGKVLLDAGWQRPPRPPADGGAKLPAQQFKPEERFTSDNGHAAEPEATQAAAPPEPFNPEERFKPMAFGTAEPGPFGSDDDRFQPSEPAATSTPDEPFQPAPDEVADDDPFRFSAASSPAAEESFRPEERYQPASSLASEPAEPGPGVASDPAGSGDRAHDEPFRPEERYQPASSLTGGPPEPGDDPFRFQPASSLTEPSDERFQPGTGVTANPAGSGDEPFRPEERYQPASSLAGGPDGPDDPAATSEPGGHDATNESFRPEDRLQPGITGDPAGSGDLADDEPFRPEERFQPASSLAGNPAESSDRPATDEPFRPEERYQPASSLTGDPAEPGDEPFRPEERYQPASSLTGDAGPPSAHEPLQPDGRYQPGGEPDDRATADEPFRPEGRYQPGSSLTADPAGPGDEPFRPQERFQPASSLTSDPAETFQPVERHQPGSSLAGQPGDRGGADEPFRPASGLTGDPAETAGEPFRPEERYQPASSLSGDPGRSADPEAFRPDERYQPSGEADDPFRPQERFQSASSLTGGSAESSDTTTDEPFRPEGRFQPGHTSDRAGSGDRAATGEPFRPEERYQPASSLTGNPAETSDTAAEPFRPEERYQPASSLAGNPAEAGDRADELFRPDERHGLSREDRTAGGGLFQPSTADEPDDRAAAGESFRPGSGDRAATGEPFRPEERYQPASSLVDQGRKDEPFRPEERYQPASSLTGGPSADVDSPHGDRRQAGMNGDAGLPEQLQDTGPSVIEPDPATLAGVAEEPELLTHNESDDPESTALHDPFADEDETDEPDLDATIATPPPRRAELPRRTESDMDTRPGGLGGPGLFTPNVPVDAGSTRPTPRPLPSRGQQGAAELFTPAAPVNGSPLDEPTVAVPEPVQEAKPVTGPPWPIKPMDGEPPLTLFRHKELRELPVGTELDRYGEPDGNLTYTVSTPFAQRSLVPDWIQRPYHAYRVARPLQALSGVAIPWFDQPGGGTAFVLPQAVAELVSAGFLVEVEDAVPPR